MCVCRGEGGGSIHLEVTLLLVEFVDQLAAFLQHGARAEHRRVVLHRLNKGSKQSVIHEILSGNTLLSPFILSTSRLIVILFGL